MGQKMTNAPVYFAIAQVRFNPILSLDAFVAGIQENFRKKGYPDFRKQSVTAFSIPTPGNGEGGAVQSPTFQSVERYMFASMDARSGFTLMQTSLSFQITNYDTFETFLAELMTGLAIVNESINLNYSERIGIRYLDAVIPERDGSIGQFLIPEVIGLSAKLKDASVSHSFMETLFTFPGVGNVLSRVIVQSGQLGFPPDLMPEGLRVEERFRGVTGQHAVIDTDGFFDGREVFDSTQVAKRLSGLHDNIHRCFHAMITDHARLAWK